MLTVLAENTITTTCDVDFNILNLFPVIFFVQWIFNALLCVESSKFNNLLLLKKALF